MQIILHQHEQRTMNRITNRMARAILVLTKSWRIVRNIFIDSHSFCDRSQLSLMNTCVSHLNMREYNTAYITEAYPRMQHARHLCTKSVLINSNEWMVFDAASNDRWNWSRNSNRIENSAFIELQRVDVFDIESMQTEVTKKRAKNKSKSCDKRFYFSNVIQTHSHIRICWV